MSPGVISPSNVPCVTSFGNFGKTLYEVFKYVGVPVEEIGYNQPAGVRYPTENPWG